ncbi:hypothetical protein ZIOFF_067908 [Zingiber officinale]|uniref:Uncharacterized protein n=1 Tax=Zingiber officinale TaxID=94328 RepID=A0A8J5EUU9_ZINOF|nr:hypothetical protein ZIOFF_067908 [Zingiber officinale]
MGFLENLEFYLKMSRKELQQLCKQNDLPANRSHSQLAKSLVSHLQKRNAVLVASLEKSVYFMDGSSKKPFASESITKQTINCPVESTTGDKRLLCQLDSEKEVTESLVNITNEKPETVTKVFCPLWPANSKGMESFSCSIFNYCNMGMRSYNVAEAQEVRTNQLLDLRHDRPHEYSMESGFVSGDEILTRIPPFQFFVMSEGGIDLFVDLSSSPLDWINSLKDDVCVHQNAKLHESMAPSKDISNLPEADDHMNISPSVNTGLNLNDIEIERNSGCTNSSLSSVVSENCNSEAYPPDTTVATSGSSVLISGSVPAGSSGLLEEIQVVSSCAPYTVQNHMASRIASCPPEEQESAIVSFAMAKSNASLSNMPLQSAADMGNGVSNPVAVGDCTPKTASVNFVDCEVEAPYNTESDVADKDNLASAKEMADNIDTENYVHKNHGGASESFTDFIIEQPDNTTHGKLSNSCQHSGQMVLDSSMADAQSEVGTVDLPFCQQSCTNCETLVPEGSISTFQDESGHSTPMEEKDASECSRIPSTSADTKRPNNLKNPKDPHVKRHLVCDKIMSVEIVTKLRNSRSSAKKILSGAIVQPRRSTRLASKFGSSLIQDLSASCLLLKHPARASGVGDSAYDFRSRNASSSKGVSSSASTKRKQSSAQTSLVNEEEINLDDEIEEEDTDGYKSSDGADDIGRSGGSARMSSGSTKTGGSTRKSGGSNKKSGPALPGEVAHRPGVADQLGRVADWSEWQIGQEEWLGSARWTGRSAKSGGSAKMVDLLVCLTKLRLFIFLLPLFFLDLSLTVTLKDLERLAITLARSIVPHGIEGDERMCAGPWHRVVIDTLGNVDLEETSLLYLASTGQTNGEGKVNCPSEVVGVTVVFLFMTRPMNGVMLERSRNGRGGRRSDVAAYHVGGRRALGARGHGRLLRLQPALESKLDKITGCM